jgi:molybdate-binding protein/transcriptional regulator with XRE-family HTH domain
MNLSSRLATLRSLRSWTQAELAHRAGISRAEVSAIENGRLVPSVATAISLANALGVSVEAVFGVRPDPPEGSLPEVGRYWEVELSAGVGFLPAECTAIGEVAHDGAVRTDGTTHRVAAHPASTLVVAGCDPAVGLLAGTMASRGVRLLPLHRSSRAALELLAEGSIHVAGLHVTDASGRAANRRAVRERLGRGYRLVRMAGWHEGVVRRPGARREPVARSTRPTVRWAAREAGSGARACLDRLLLQEGHQRSFRHTARDHRMVAELVRAGWADAGICVQLVADEAGLDFVPVQPESYDLCFAADLADDPRVVQLVGALQSRPFRELLADLPGYVAAETGEVEDA